MSIPVKAQACWCCTVTACVTHRQQQPTVSRNCRHSARIGVYLVAQAGCTLTDSRGRECNSNQLSVLGCCRQHNAQIHCPVTAQAGCTMTTLRASAAASAASSWLAGAPVPDCILILQATAGPSLPHVMPQEHSGCNMALCLSGRNQPLTVLSKCRQQQAQVHLPARLRRRQAAPWVWL